MYFSNKQIKLSFLYNIGIAFMDFGLKCASHFNQKLALGVNGRQETFKILKDKLNPNDQTLWFHCASLGEYEQGLPVFKELRKHYQHHKIVLSFFSPSGYEIRKSSPIADMVIYLPLDSKKNAKLFLDLIHPELTIFVKYDIWPNYLNELKKRKLRAILISAVFRKEQTYFKFYGKELRNALFAFEHIFTQNEASKLLLQSVNYNDVTISGDTRFDRVLNQLETDNTLEFVERFKNNKLCVVAGSTWPEDETLLINFINSGKSDNVKFIIAPHNIKTNQIKNIQEKLTVECVLFSEKDAKQLETAQVLIIDTIGILSKIYSYADIAYIGGAMGTTGLHNTLEAAVFGIPIVIGNNHQKFPEAKAMIDAGGMLSVSNQNDLNIALNNLINDSDKRINLGKKASEYVIKNKGAVIKILQYLGIKSS